MHAFTVEPTEARGTVVLDRRLRSMQTYPVRARRLPPISPAQKACLETTASPGQDLVIDASSA